MGMTAHATPTALNDATTKQYVDNMMQGLTIKEPVRAVGIAPITLASLVAGSTLDGVTLLVNDRILLSVVRNNGTFGRAPCPRSPRPTL